MSSNSDEDNPDESTDDSSRSYSTGGSGQADVTSGPCGVLNIDRSRRAEAQRIADCDLSEEELAASIRAQTSTVSGFGDDLADKIEQSDSEAVDTSELTADLLELSNLLVEIAHTVGQTRE